MSEALYAPGCRKNELKGGGEGLLRRLCGSRRLQEFLASMDWHQAMRQPSQCPSPSRDGTTHLC